MTIPVCSEWEPSREIAAVFFVYLQKANKKMVEVERYIQDNLEELVNEMEIEGDVFVTHDENGKADGYAYWVK